MMEHGMCCDACYRLHNMMDSHERQIEIWARRLATTESLERRTQIKAHLSAERAVYYSLRIAYFGSAALDDEVSHE